MTKNFQQFLIGMSKDNPALGKGVVPYGGVLTPYGQQLRQALAVETIGEANLRMKILAALLREIREDLTEDAALKIVMSNLVYVAHHEVSEMPRAN